VFTDRGVAIAFSVSEGINEVTSNADSNEVVPKSTSSTSSRDLPQARFGPMSALPTIHWEGWCAVALPPHCDGIHQVAYLELV
jgi:hypothetical protein